MVECKPDEELKKRSIKWPDRYRLDPERGWVSPAGEAAARELGLGYRIVTENHLSPTLVRNARFLLDYLDLHSETNLVEDMERLTVDLRETEFVNVHEAVSNGISSDAVYFSIAQSEVYFPLEEQILAHPKRAWVYRDKAAYLKHARFLAAPEFKPALFELSTGMEVDWGEESWTVATKSENAFTLVSQDGRVVSLSLAGIQQLYRSNKIHLRDHNGAVCGRVKRLQDASRGELEKALTKYHWVEQYKASAAKQAKNVIDGNRPSTRTIRRWLAAYERAKHAYGNGLLGLLPRTKARGNQDARLSQSTLEVLERSIKEDYLSIVAPTIRWAYAAFVRRCEESSVDSCSYETYRRAIREIPSEKSLTVREGWKSADRAVHPVANDASVPVHGDRPWEVAHVDHTQMDIQLVSFLDGRVLGRPWISVLIDAFSKMVLAFVLSFEGPSARSLMNLFRDCVRRHNRLPSAVVSDRGAEFLGTYYETFLASYGITKIDRPPGRPRHGAPIERFFGVMNNQLTLSLPGNTKANKLGRSQVKSHAPESHASLSPEQLMSLIETWISDSYHQTPGRGTLQSPNNIYHEGMVAAGGRSHMRVEYDEKFILDTLLTPSAPTRSVRRGRPIRFNHLDYYSADLATLKSEKAKAFVRYDPYDASYIVAEINNNVYRLASTSPIVRRLSEVGVVLMHEELSFLGHNANQLIRGVYKSPSISQADIDGCRRQRDVSRGKPESYGDSKGSQAFDELPKKLNVYGVVKGQKKPRGGREK